MASKENNYRFPQFSFSGLAANDNNYQQHLPLNREQRNSFDILVSESNDLLEMTGGDFKSFMKEKIQIKDQ